MRKRTITRKNSRRAAWLFTIAILILWWAASLVYPPYLVPRPLVVLDTMLQFIGNWNYASHSLATLWHICFGIIAALILGSLLATLAYFFPIFDTAIHHRLSPFANSFSSIGWTILVVVWLGIGQATVLTAMTAILLPFVLVNLKIGFSNLSAELIEMASAFSNIRWRRIRLIIFPLLVPYFSATIRITFGMACQIVLIAELFGGNSGLGYLVNIASQEVDTTLIFAVGLLMVILFLAVDHFALDPIQRHLTKTYDYL